MAHALILSGGGALGAYEAAAAAEIIRAHERIGEPIEIVSGTSVGALNAAMIAQGRTEQMLEIWRRLRKRDVLRGGSLGGISTVWRLLRGRSIYDCRPLDTLVRANVDAETLRRSRMQLLVHAADLLRKRLVYWTNDSPTIIDGIIASTRVPGFMPHSRMDGMLLVDGGVIANTPIRSAIDHGATRLTIIYLDDEKIASRTSFEHAERQGGPGKVPDDLTSLWIARRSFEIMMTSHLERDLKLLEAINQLVAARNGRTVQYKHVEVRMLQPSHPLPAGHTFDFDREKLDAMLTLGKKDALSFLTQ